MIGSRLASAPGAALLVRAVRVACVAWLCVAALAWAVSGVEGRALPPGALGLLLGPFAWAFGVAIAVAGSVRRGEWSGWQALGIGPHRLAAGVVGLGILLGLVSANSGALEAVPGWALPAPVSPVAAVWPADGGWQRVEPDGWTVAPSALSTGELWRRARSKAPEGSRAGVDRAELARRVGWALSWPLAALLGFVFGRRPARSATLGEAVGAVEATGGVGLWLLVVALLAAYASTIT